MNIYVYSHIIIARRGAHSAGEYMKIYEIILRKTMIMKDIAEKTSEEELNDRYYQFDKYDGNILFYEDEQYKAMKLYKAIEKEEIHPQLINGYFKTKYYKIGNVELNELKIDERFINKEKIEKTGGLMNHKLDIYVNTLSEIIIKSKSYTIKDLKKYIKNAKKEGK